MAGSNHTHTDPRGFTTKRIVIGIVALVAIFLAVTFYSGALAPAGGPTQGAACPTPAAEAAVRAYTLALTSPDTLRSFVQENATAFGADGDAIECYAALASALGPTRELSQIDAIRERADAERETGLDFDRAAYVADLAHTLRELADSLPSLARADQGPYSKTQAYASAQAYSTLMRRAPGAAAGVDALIRADAEVLHELAGLTNKSR